MKVVLLLFCMSIIQLTPHVHGAAVESPVEIVSLDDLPQANGDYLAYLDQETVRTKRSKDILELLKAKLASSVKSKLNHVASASSYASHGKEYHHHHYEPPPESYDEKSFDFWDLQKSILNTLLQAVKAIKGGLIAIKGHLIKGSGYIISAKGKLITAKGEAITNIGKHIASSALLSPKKHHSHSSHHPPSVEITAPEPVYGPPMSSGYSAPSGHGPEYLHPHDHGSTHSSYSDHKFPPSFEAYKDHLQRGGHHGILILKKIPKGHKDKYNGNDGSNIPSETHISDSKPEEPSVPPFTFLPDIKDIFSTTSFKGHEEAHSVPSSSAHLHSEYPGHEASHHHNSYPHDHEPSPFPDKPPSTEDKPLSSYEYSPPANEHKFSHNSHHSSNNFEDHSNPGPPATNYGTPFGTTDNTFQDYFKDFNTFQLSQFSNNQHHTALLPHTHSDLETYDPLKLPSIAPSPLTTSLPSIGSHKFPQKFRGLEHFPSYPVDLSNSFGAPHKLGNMLRFGLDSYAVHEPDSEASSLWQKHPLSTLPLPLQLRNFEKLPVSTVLHSKSLRSNLLAQLPNRKWQPSYGRSISRRKRPKNYEIIGPYRLGSRGPTKID